MIKKTLILASILAFAASTQVYAEDAQPAVPTKKADPALEKASPECHKPPKRPECNKKKSEFEKRLKLTEEQKAQAKQIRMKGHEEMKPVMEKIKALKDEEDAVRRSRIAPQMQEEKIKEIRGQMRELHKQARELRMKNMKEFESILTKKQLKELNKMKEEGRKRFEKEFKKQHGNSIRPPFGPPPAEFGHGPAVPPPPPAPAPEPAPVEK